MIDWSQIKLVVFDVDGTLYSQHHLRIRMAARLALSCLRQRSTATIRIVRHYRKHRETLAGLECQDFEALLLADTARATGLPLATVADTIDEWLNRRPLALLRAARYRHLDRVFAALRARGVLIGVLSDYPAQAKLEAMGLNADLIIWAGQPNVGVLKPHPRGLQLLLSEAGVDAAQALMIGDRDDRDGEVARRSGVGALIRSSKSYRDRQTFKAYDGVPFHALLHPATLA